MLDREACGKALRTEPIDQLHAIIEGLVAKLIKDKRDLYARLSHGRSPIAGAKGLSQQRSGNCGNNELV